ncbi:YcaO-like family protein [Pseudoalteromonas sp. SMS1]|uniref:YcaO-like family protein n=1 Tax=Pseudoalteromonas sp. SMS1 TaxID=2908894 RepID=UPI001F20478E|nr:YcaO-like family protein [Pseudoalteromonas sp. SMS1]MCF2858198.1 YcaO-like family protein [Pseudoalteromonas sp. SMS1]
MKKHYFEGTHRVISPQQTLNRITPYFTAMGITRIANVTGLDNIGLPVATACRPNSKAVAVSQGKGTTLVAAKVSAAMEAIETYHAENIDLPLKLMSYNELKNSYPCVEQSSLPKLNVKPFCPKEKRLWIASHTFVQNDPLYVPYDLVHCDYTLPLPTGSGVFQMSTNGLASGNTLEEAQLHGLCEVIERDALCLWSLKSNTKYTHKRIDLETVQDDTVKALLAQLSRAGVLCGAWETTSDVGVPTFLATILDAEENPHRRLYSASGAGTHPNAIVALLRAITEAVQTRLTLISGSRDDINLSKYESKRQQESVNQLRNLLLEKPETQIAFQAIPSHSGETINDDLNYVLGCLAGVNIHPTYVDLTKPAFNIPVVRVIAPNLEGIHDVPGYVFGSRANKLRAQMQRTEK